MRRGYICLGFAARWFWRGHFWLFRKWTERVNMGVDVEETGQPKLPPFTLQTWCFHCCKVYGWGVKGLSCSGFRCQLIQVAGHPTMRHAALLLSS